MRRLSRRRFHVALAGIFGALFSQWGCNRMAKSPPVSVAQQKLLGSPFLTLTAAEAIDAARTGYSDGLGGKVHEALKRVGRIGPLSREVVGRNYSNCLRCQTTWLFVRSHSTELEHDGRYAGGCFPLCVECWEELTPATRLPFYRQLFDSWVAESDGVKFKAPTEERWQDMERAVMAGG